MPPHSTNRYADAMGRIFAAMALAFALFATLPSPAAEGDGAAAVIERVNAFRNAHGLRPVASDPKLMAAAQAHAEAMAASGVFSHNGSDGSLTERMVRAGYAYATAAENIGHGARTAEETVAGWIQSPPHMRNLLEPTVRDAGVGHVMAAAKGHDPATDYWCLILGEPAPP